MWNGSILGEMTTGAATIIGIVGLCVIATSNKAIKSKNEYAKNSGGLGYGLEGQDCQKAGVQTLNNVVNLLIIIIILFFILIYSGVDWAFALVFLVLGYLFAGIGLAMWYWFNKKIRH